MKGSLMTLACDDEASQILLEDLPAGPAGEARLSPVDGVELLFDNADGRLARVLVDVAAYHGQRIAGELARFFIAGLLGTEAAAAVDEAHHWDGAPLPLRVDEGKLADLSRLARLDAARAASPFADSPGWAVEAAQLAGPAGMTAGAAAEARRATAALAGAPPDVLPTAIVRAVAEAVQEIDAGLAERLRERAALRLSARIAADGPDRAWLAAPTHVCGDGADAGGLERWLDPQIIPAGVFRHHVWPEADLTVQVTESAVRVEAEVVPGADRRALAGCRARLVDPARRAVICTAPFQEAGGSRVSAELPRPVPSAGVWAEVAGEPSRPVCSARLRHIRRAMRWADTALLAGRRPPGRASAEWDRLARRAWERCAEDWSAAEDADRAYLAAERARALGSRVSMAEPPSAWAKDAVRRRPLREAPFLAETAGLTETAG
jgi:hypothetical protein